MVQKILLRKHKNTLKDEFKVSERNYHLNEVQVNYLED